MPAIQTDGDTNSAGGVVSGGAASVRVNGKSVTLEGNPVSSHAPWGKPHPPHQAATTTGGSGSVRAGGIGIVTTGCADTCGHPRVGGSSDVRIG
jgi:uncharacterized Zn-binding protein involved in type VI secretion